MRRLLHIIAALAALVLAGCSAKDVLVTKPVSLDVKIENVTGSKMYFSVSTGKQDAAYTFFIIGDDEPSFDIPEIDAAKAHIQYLQLIYDRQDAAGNFIDFSCYKGSRQLELNLLSSDKEYKLLVFQVHPKTYEVLGDIVSEHFHTNKVAMESMWFDFSFSDDVLIIEPSDPERSYIWSFERVARIDDDYDHDPFYYLYDLIDMYEEYGFIDHRLCVGTDFCYMPDKHLRKDERYVVTAIGYDDGEINSDISFRYFLYSDNGYFIEQN